MRVLEDQRIAAALLWLWLMVMLVLLWNFGAFTNANEYLRFGIGPGPDLKFIGMDITTWTRWCILAFGCFVDQAMTTWSSDMIAPWISNTIADHKTTHLPYSKCTCVCVAVSFYSYHDLRYVIFIYMAFTQVDLLLMRVAVNVLVTIISHIVLMRGKKIEPKLAQEADEHTQMLEIV